MVKDNKLRLEREIDNKLYEGYSTGFRVAPEVPKTYSVEYEVQSVNNGNFEEDIVYALCLIIAKEVRVPRENKEIRDLVHKSLKFGIMHEIYGEIKNELVKLHYNFSRVLGKYGRDEDVLEIYNKVKELIKLMEGDSQ